MHVRHLTADATAATRATTTVLSDRTLTLEQSRRITEQISKGVRAVDLVLLAMRRGEADRRLIIAAEKIKIIWMDLLNAASSRHNIISGLSNLNLGKPLIRTRQFIDSLTDYIASFRSSLARADLLSLLQVQMDNRLPNARTLRLAIFVGH